MNMKKLSNLTKERVHEETSQLHIFNSSTNGERTIGDAASSSSTWGFRQILDHIDVGIVVLDLQKLLIEYRNPVFYQVLGNIELCDDYQALCQMFVSDLQEAQEGSLAGVLSGIVKVKERLLGCSAYLIENKFRCIFIRDITERVRLETIAHAVNSMDSLGFIFSGIRHEIGNPMNSLKMTLSVLKQNLGRFTEQTISDYVDRSLADISRVEYLLKSLKSFSMFELVNLADVSFNKYMEGFLALAKRDLQQRGILITVTSQPNLGSVRIDSRAMNQVLLNIVANAADALEGRPNPEITFTTRLRDQLLWLTVRDNGCGISPKQQKHLFQPFNSRKPSGNGLGLVITRKLLALMDSSVDIESQPNEGTSVTISLPTSGSFDNELPDEERKP